MVREGGGDFVITEVLSELEAEMAQAAAKLEFERAALLRDQIRELKKQAGMKVLGSGCTYCPCGRGAYCGMGSGIQPCCGGTCPYGIGGIVFQFGIVVGI